MLQLCFDTIDIEARQLEYEEFAQRNTREPKLWTRPSSSRTQPGDFSIKAENLRGATVGSTL